MADPTLDAEFTEEREFEVFEDNWPIVEMFLRLQTQWNVNMGSFVGLNYQSAEFLFKIHGVGDPVEMLDGLQTMEIAALGVINKRDDK